MAVQESDLVLVLVQPSFWSKLCGIWAKDLLAIVFHPSVDANDGLNQSHSIIQQLSEQKGDEYLPLPERIDHKWWPHPQARPFPAGVLLQGAFLMPL